MQEETGKKWEERSTFGSIGSVRGKMSALFAIKKYMVSECVEIMHVSRQCVTK